MILPTPLEVIQAERVISSYRQALSMFTTENSRQNALRRMADLTMVATEDRLINATLVQRRDTPIVDTTQKEWSVETDDSEIGYAAAINIYLEILKNPESIPDQAEVYYLLAKAYDLNGQTEESLTTLTKLINEFAESRYHNEVQFRRGEMLFVMGDHALAAEAYEDVLISYKTDRNQSTTFYEHSLYKQGWTYYKLNNYDQALVYFVRLLDHIIIGSETHASTRTLAKLKEDTFRASSMAFANLDGPASVAEFFKEYGDRPFDYDIYKSLASFYLHQERYLDAGQTFQTFVDAHPLHPEAPNFVAGIIQVYRQGGFPSLILPIKEQFATRFGINSEYWKSATSEKRESYKPELKRHLIELAQHYHSNAQKRKKRALYKKAATWYQDYLVTFPHDPDARTMNKLLGESLFSAKDFVAAIREFEKTAYGYREQAEADPDFVGPMPKALSPEERIASSEPVPDSDPNSEAAKSGYFSLLAYQELLRNFKGTEEEKQKWVAQKIAASFKFVKSFPGHSRSSLIADYIVEDQLFLKDIAGAVKTSRMIVSVQPPPPQKLIAKAWQTIANGEFDLTHYPEAEAAFDTVIANKYVSGKKLALINDRLAASIYRQAEAMKANGATLEAAKEFLRLGVKMPNAKIRVNADFDAAALYLEIKEWALAIQTLEAFRARYPAHKFTHTVPAKLALAYESTEQWARASSELEKMVLTSKSPKSEESRQAMWIAAEYQEKAKDSVQAIRLYKEYVWKFKKPLPQKIEGQYRLVKLYEEQKDISKRNFWLNKLIQEYKKAGSNSSDRSQYLAAYASFTLTEPLYAKYKKVKLNLPLGKSLKKKRKLMAKALKAYISTAEIGVSEFASASTYRIGDIYLSLANDLMDSQRPKGLNELELEQYEILLEEQAYPFEDQAIEILESNADLVLEDIYDSWVKKSFDALGKLLPGRYAKEEQVEAFIESIY